MPRSLFGRLLTTAIVALLAALAFAGVTIGHVLERFVVHGLDERLDAQIMVVARAVRPDGRLDPARLVDVPPFDVPGSGWAWQVRGPFGVARSASLGGIDLVAPMPRDRPPRGVGPSFGARHPNRDRPHPFDGIDAFGRALHGRLSRVPTPAGEVEILVAGPRSVVDRPLREAVVPLLVSLLLLGVALSLAILVQLRFGLRPIAGMQAMVAQVRAGRRRHVDATEPTELLPLVDELNALIDANEAALVRARGHAANLAHGLKTPLATLRLDLAGQDRDPDGRLIAQVERIDRQIRHHLGRARAASPAGGARVATPLAPHVDDIVAALARIHAERGVAARVTIPRGLAVHCDPQDLDEMLGNLIDNAWRWATSQVAITVSHAGPLLEIAIADDGAGIADDALATVLEPGRRLDERGDGHGFGLSIATELAELYGGSIMLRRGEATGLVAVLALPAA